MPLAAREATREEVRESLYQKRYCGGIDWRAGNLVQYVGAGVLFALGAVAFETREIHWTGELIFRNGLARAGPVDRSRCIDVLAHPPLRSDRVRKSVLSGAGRDRLVRFFSVSGWTRFRSLGC
jgi:hypothetical protein